jgi:hypothetical protein
MKFFLLAFVAATQLSGIHAAAQGLCKTNTSVSNPGALTWQIVTDYVAAFRTCTLKHYRSSCLTHEFHQRVSEIDFINQNYDYMSIDESDKRNPPDAFCIMVTNHEEMYHGPDYRGQTSSNPLTGRTNSGVRHNRILNQIEEFGISALNMDALQDLYLTLLSL